jgi:hypothetical protein
MEKIFKSTYKNPEYPNHPEIYDLCMARAKFGTLQEKRCWIHLTDAVESGTITPMEAYDTIKIGYVAEHLKIRKSRYSHLI